MVITSSTNTLDISRSRALTHTHSLIRDVYLWKSINKEYMVHHPYTHHITSTPYPHHTLNYMASQHIVPLYIHIVIIPNTSYSIASSHLIMVLFQLIQNRMDEAFHRLIHRAHISHHITI